MRRTTNLIKISVMFLSVILLRNVILNSINVYQSVHEGENPRLILVTFIFGTILGLTARVGLTLLFWYSYNIKYANEKYNERILRKVLISILFLSIVSVAPLGRGMLMVFIICTLSMILRENNRIDRAVAEDMD